MSLEKDRHSPDEWAALKVIVDDYLYLSRIHNRESEQVTESTNRISELVQEVHDLRTRIAELEGALELACKHGSAAQLASALDRITELERV